MVAAAILGFIVYRYRSTGFDWAAFRGTFRGVHWGWMIASIPFILSTYVGRALRWRVMVLPIKPDSSLWNIVVATAVGFTAVVFFGRAGELVRPYLIAKKEQVSFSSQVAAWLLERILDLMLVLLIFGFALAQISRSGVELGPKLKLILQVGGSVIGVAGAACIAILLLFRYFTTSMQQRLFDALGAFPDRLRTRLQSFLTAFLDGMQSTRSNSYVLQLVMYSILEWGLIVLCYVCLLRAFPVTEHFSLTDIVIFMGFMSFGSAVQIPGVGGGMQVAAIFVFTEFFRVPLESATGLALILWAVSFLVIVPIGVVLALRDGLHWKSLSHIGEEGAAP